VPWTIDIIVSLHSKGLRKVSKRTVLGHSTVPGNHSNDSLKV
jgi:hypothetical protein